MNKISAKEIRKKYLDFFESKGHTIIPSASLLPPENDSSALFTTAGMQPLVPYFLGEKHPGGKKVANAQKCIRTGDVDEVGDNRHLTFFEMLGNWSFGDYFKEDAIKWSFEFLIDKEKGLGIDPQRIYVTVFRGDEDVPRDERSIEIWKEVFEEIDINAKVSEEGEVTTEKRIIPLGKEDNFWMAGETGPRGPDSEMFYDTRPEEGEISGNFADLVDSGRIIEIWNDVFMEFNKEVKEEKKEEYNKLQTESKPIPEEFYKYEKLKQKNVDTGMGIERTLAILNGKDSVFETELFRPIFEKIVDISEKKYEENLKEFRIIADHLKASVFIIADGVTPSNTLQGYVLRRLIRRAVRYGKVLGVEENFTQKVGETVIEMYKEIYPELEENRDRIFEELNKEEEKFRKTLKKGLKEFDKLEVKMRADYEKNNQWDYLVVGKIAFDLYQRLGFPIEMFFEELEKRNIPYIDDKKEAIKKFEKEMKKHQELSRTASAGKFKGGLADGGEETVKLHTAAHLLLAALREVLGEETYQKGSNITAERLRFDFNYPEKLTDEQKKEIEDLVNEKIEKNLPVEMVEMPKDEALEKVKVSFDPGKYGDVVKVYKIGSFSSELCGGPHVKNTGELGKFKIKKEQSSGAGVRRIKAVLE